MIKGLDQTTNPEATAEGYAYWAKNILSNKKFDASINCLGNLEIFNLSAFNIVFKNGVTTLGPNIILFYKDNANRDCITVFNEFTGVGINKVARTDLNFNISYPINAVAKYNPKNQIVVAFVDGLNPNRYINLDTATDLDPINFYNLFPLTTNASNIQTEVLDSGALLTGIYIGTFQYISKDRTRSQWTTLSNPTYITTIDSSLSSVSTKGTASNLGSNKSIKFTLSDLDTTYSKIALAIISKINGIVTQKIVKEVSITSSTLTTIYNGTEFISDVTLEELITDNIRYLTARHIETLEDQLFLADLTASPSIDFQAIVNKTTITWTSVFDEAKNLVVSSKYKAGNFKTFIHDEVYAFYMQLELIDGSFSSWFHIPGRALTGGELADSSLYNAGLTIDGLNPKVFQVEDTCNHNIDYPDGTRGGILGAWENQNEFYPSSFPDYTGQKVRHHKFPSVQFQVENTWNDKQGYGLENLDRLGIKITNSFIDYTIVKGYRVGYAKRTLADTGVLGMGLTMFAGSPETTTPNYDFNSLMSTGGNFAINSLNGANDNLNINKSYLRFNSFDIWQDRPSVEGSYLRNYLKLKVQGLATGFNGDGSNKEVDYGTIAAGSYLSTPQVDLTSYASNFTKTLAGHAVRFLIASGDKIRKLSSQSYVPNNVKYSQGGVIIENKSLEEYVLAKIEGTALNLNAIGTINVHSGNAQAEDPTLAEETYLSALKIAKADYFLSFDNQSIVVNPSIFRTPLVTNTLFDTGDGFIGLHSYVSLAPYNKNAIDSITESIVNFKMHVGVSRHNVNLRYQILGDYSTYFYSDSGQFTLGGKTYNQYWFWLNPRTAKWNNFQYSKDFSTVNDFEVFGVFNRDVADQDTFNYRIVRSTKANRENALEDGWKTFKATDYFDTVRNKGRITNLQAWGTDALIIHHESALFRTRDKAVLQANIINISLGSGDIFALEPKEENPTRVGTGGTQHKWSCILTDAGYFFVDEQVKAVYLYDGNQLRDISKGFNNFFYNFLDCQQDNPYNYDGITSAYDQANNRILLSQKAGDNSFTVSYDLSRGGEWESAHDFIPNYMFNSRVNLYSFNVNRLYVHNLGERGKYYGQTYPTYIDYIVNDSPNTQKILAALLWLTKFKNSDTSTNQRKTITSVTVWNDQHCSDKIDIITNETDSLFVDANTKVVDENWSFNELADRVIDPNQPFVLPLLQDSRPIPSNIQQPVWYDSEPLRGKFFIVRLEYSNIENKEVHLRELIPLLRKSES